MSTPDVLDLITGSQAMTSFAERLEEARKLLPSDLGPAIELLCDRDVGKSDVERHAITRLGSLAADACLAQHNPRQARRAGGGLAGAELERWRAEALRLTQALHRRNLLSRWNYGACAELETLVIESLDRDVPTERRGSDLLRDFLDAAGLGGLEVIAAYSAGSGAIHALADGGARTLCGREPDDYTTGWIRKLLLPGLVDCGRCLRSIEKAAREPFDLDEFFYELDQQCHSSATLAARNKAFGKEAVDWEACAEEALRGYLLQAANSLLNICYEEIDGTLSRAITGKRLRGHRKFGRTHLKLIELLHEHLMLTGEPAAQKLKRFKAAVREL